MGGHREKPGSCIYWANPALVTFVVSVKCGGCSRYTLSSALPHRPASSLLLPASFCLPKASGFFHPPLFPSSFSPFPLLISEIAVVFPPSPFSFSLFPPFPPFLSSPSPSFSSPSPLWLLQPAEVCHSACVTFLQVYLRRLSPFPFPVIKSRIRCHTRVFQLTNGVLGLGIEKGITVTS